MPEAASNVKPACPQMMTFMPRDPIMFLAMAPFLPLILFFNALQGTMMMTMPRMMYPEQTKTKVTSITRIGNTLDIVEKWI